jgi:hypothetical protein
MLGVTVDPKGENAIHALLHMRDNALLTQSNAQSLCASSKGSIQKYRKLLEQLRSQQPALLHDQQIAPLPASVQLASVPPASMQLASVQPASIQPLVRPAWMLEHTPSVTALHVVGNERVADNTYHRVLRVSIALPSGAIERDATVLFDPTAGAAEANWKREAAAIRQLAAAWSELPAAEVADPAIKQSSGVNIVRVKSGCNWHTGDWVWIPAAPVASYTLPVAAAAEHPALAKVARCFANGALEVVMFDDIELCFDENERQTLPPCSTAFEMQQQALHLCSRRPRYVGEAVRLVRKQSYKDVWYKDEFDEWACDERLTEDGTEVQLVRRSPAEAWRSTGKRHPHELNWRVLPHAVTLIDDGRISLDDLGTAGISMASGLDFVPDLAKIVAIDLEREVVVSKADHLSAEAMTCGTVDVVLFNPVTMQYDGHRICSVPLTPCVSALGRAAPLAEARAVAIQHVCATAGGQRAEALERIERVCALDDVQSIADELHALPCADEPCRLIMAREFEVQHAKAFEDLILEQAALQQAQRSVGVEWPPSDPTALTLEAALQISRDMRGAYWAWNDATADPSFAFPQKWLHVRGTCDSHCPRTGATWLPFEGQTLNDWLCARFDGPCFSAECFPRCYPFQDTDDTCESESEDEDDQRHVGSRRSHTWGGLTFTSISKASQQYGGGALAAGESGEESGEESGGEIGNVSEAESSAQYLQPWTWAPEPEPEWEWG